MPGHGSDTMLAPGPSRTRGRHPGQADRHRLTEKEDGGLSGPGALAGVTPRARPERPEQGPQQRGSGTLRTAASGPRGGRATSPEGPPGFGTTPFGVRCARL